MTATFYKTLVTYGYLPRRKNGIFALKVFIRIGYRNNFVIYHCTHSSIGVSQHVMLLLSKSSPINHTQSSVSLNNTNNFET